MAATKQQGQSLSIFLVGLTTACAGLAWISMGLGKLALAVGLVILAVALARFFSIKKEEGAIALGAQPAAMKAVGLLVTILGWALVLFGLHLTHSVGGRMVFAIAGLVVACIGPLVILPAACNKNAIWKA